MAREPRAEDLLVHDALALRGELVLPCRDCRARPDKRRRWVRGRASYSQDISGSPPWLLITGAWGCWQSMKAIDSEGGRPNVMLYHDKRV